MGLPLRLDSTQAELTRDASDPPCAPPSKLLLFGTHRLECDMSRRWDYKLFIPHATGEVLPGTIWIFCVIAGILGVANHPAMMLEVLGIVN